MSIENYTFVKRNLYPYSLNLSPKYPSLWFNSALQLRNGTTRKLFALLFGTLKCRLIFHSHQAYLQPRKLLTIFLISISIWVARSKYIYEGTSSIALPNSKHSICFLVSCRIVLLIHFFQSLFYVASNGVSISNSFFSRSTDILRGIPGSHRCHSKSAAHCCHQGIPRVAFLKYQVLPCNFYILWLYCLPVSNRNAVFPSAGFPL